MKVITQEQLDTACAAYARATGIYPNKAGMRAAFYSLDLEGAVRANTPAGSPDRLDENCTQDHGSYWSNR